MQFKPIPEPPSDPTETIESVRNALPAESDSELDCCARVIDDTWIETREVASEWITFLRALELAVSEPDGYRRASRNETHAGEAFRRRVVGVDAVLGALEVADEPLTAAEVDDSLAARGERSRGTGRRTGDGADSGVVDRIDRILAWAEVFELVDRRDGRYRLRS
ncbi:hypothetical protein [Halovivax gelatinilyticus]|uniref:hypothetical protein n=1 Tax=Halovivax gelatinilyticus TaxID=2961597 RepID=UPI0020CA2DE6|nr:hypothetical protein [Halovivax gelatinilyticus]